MEWVKRLFGPPAAPKVSRLAERPTRRVTVNDPLVIESPRIGFLNLIGSSALPILEEDQRALRPIFGSVEKSSVAPLVCDVLMIYAHMEIDGSITGCTDGLRDIIRKSGATIVIVASENEGKSYVAGSKNTGYGRANLILTLKRKGAVFTDFLSQLFNEMLKGKSMLLAWVDLAPQIPGATHENCPESIFAAEISHIIFK